MEIRQNVGDDAEDGSIDIEQLAEVVAKKVLEKLNAQEKREETEENTVTEETQETQETENSSIDYSSFEERLAKLN